MSGVRALVRAGVLGLAALSIQAGAQSGEPEIRIISPEENAYVGGRMVLEAKLEPSADIQSVVFYVDGRQVCTFAQAPFECVWDAGRQVDEHQVRVVATLPGGQRLVRTLRTQALDYTEHVDVDIVQVTATVTDNAGNFIKGLPRSAFRVFEDGRPQRLTYFESEDVPLDLLVALDISASMTAAMPTLKAAAKSFLSAVPTRDRVTLLGFNDRVFTLTRNTTDMAERSASLDRLAPWGGTALYDVVVRGVDMLGRSSGRKALIVFTDGEDQGSRATLEDVHRRLQATDATLYMIGQGRGTSVQNLKAIMESLSRPTGGRAIFMEEIDELHRAFTELLEELSNQYLLGYPPSNAKRDGTLRRIGVEVDGKYSVRARQEYRAPLETDR
jgi:Ca-activated chloride channel homolog